MSIAISIGEAAKMLGVTTKTLRHYEKLGLLSPRRAKNGYRLFDAGQIWRAIRIRRLQKLGLSLGQIRLLLGEAGPEPPWQEILRSSLVEIEDQAQILEKRRSLLQKLLAENNPEALDQPFEMPAALQLVQKEASAQLESASPELREMEKKLFGLLESFPIPDDYQERLMDLLAYLSSHPDMYRELLSMAEALLRLKNTPPDAPQIGVLARDYARLLRDNPRLNELLGASKASPPAADLLAELMVLSNSLSPGQVQVIQNTARQLEGEA